MIKTCKRSEIPRSGLGLETVVAPVLETASNHPCMKSSVQRREVAESSNSMPRLASNKPAHQQTQSGRWRIWDCKFTEAEAGIPEFPRLEEAVFSEAKSTKLNLQHGPEAAKSQAQLISPFLPSVLMSQRDEAADRF